MIKFVLGGAMDPSYKSTLSKMEQEGKAAADRTASAMTRSAAALERQILLAQKEGRSYEVAAAALARLNAERARFGLTKEQAVSIGAGEDVSTVGSFKSKAARRRAGKESADIRESGAGGMDREVQNDIARSRRQQQEEDAIESVRIGEEKRAADVEMASRNNRAAELRRTRAEKRAAAAESVAEQARLDSVNSAARSNEARALLRQRAEEKRAAAERLAEEARQASVEAASRANKLSALQRQRAEEKKAAAERRAEEDASRYTKTGVQRKGEALRSSLISASGSLFEAEAGGNPVVIAAARKGKADAIRAMRAYEAQFGKRSHMGAFGGASSAMMISVARDTMASLASGANPITVFMQQAPQVMQAMTMMNKGMFDFVKTALKIPIGPWGIFAGIVAGLAVGLLAAYAHSKALVDKLSGIKLPDLPPDYIAKHLKKVNLLAEAWKDVGRNVRNTIADYNSVASAAERLAAKSKTEFDHRRKMLNLEKEMALSGVKSPVLRADIEKQYRDKLAALDQQERDAKLASSQKEARDLVAEGNRLMGQSGQLLKTVPGKTAEEENVRQNKAKLDAADAAAKAVLEARNAQGFLGVNGRDAFRAYNAVSASPVTSADLNKAEDQILKDRAMWRKNYEDSVDRLNANDRTRKAADDLRSRADKSLNRAAELALKNQEQAKTNAQESADTAAENEAQDKLDRKRAMSSASGSAPQRLEWERAGGFLGGPQIALLDVTRSIDKKMTQVVNNTKPGAARRGPWGR